MNVKVERGGDGNVPQQNGDSLVIAFTLDAAGGEAVAQGMETHGRNIKLVEDAQKIVPVIAWLQRVGGVGYYHVVLWIYKLYKRLDC